MRKSLNILLVEDDMIEIMKFNRTISKLACLHNIIEAKNGEEALDILYKNESLPDLILLDLNMPKINGLEFLSIIRNNDQLKYIPTVILTSSNDHKDVSECHALGISGYLVKPLKFIDYSESIKNWLSTNVNEHVFKANEEYELIYTINVPDDVEIDGSFLGRFNG